MGTARPRQVSLHICSQRLSHSHCAGPGRGVGLLFSAAGSEISEQPLLQGEESPLPGNLTLCKKTKQNKNSIYYFYSPSQTHPLQQEQNEKGQETDTCYVAARARRRVCAATRSRHTLPRLGRGSTRARFPSFGAPFPSSRTASDNWSLGARSGGRAAPTLVLGAPSLPTPRGSPLLDEKRLVPGHAGGGAQAPAPMSPPKSFPAGGPAKAASGPPAPSLTSPLRPQLRPQQGQSGQWVRGFLPPRSPGNKAAADLGFPALRKDGGLERVGFKGYGLSHESRDLGPRPEIRQAGRSAHASPQGCRELSCTPPCKPAGRAGGRPGRRQDLVFSC